MTNKKMFDIANESADARIKKVVRDSFLDWCLKNGRTPLGDFSFQDWCKEEWKGEA